MRQLKLSRAEARAAPSDGPTFCAATTTKIRKGAVEAFKMMALFALGRDSEAAGSAASSGVLTGAAAPPPAMVTVPAMTVVGAVSGATRLRIQG